MNKTLFLFVVAVTAISIIISILLVCYVIRRKRNITGADVGSQVQNDRKDVGLWKFLIVFGLIFLMIPATGLIFQTVRTQDWKEIPAVISEMRTVRSGTKRKQNVFVSYQFGGRTFENISANTSIKQRGVKKETQIGQKIVILVNPDNPSQIIAFNNLLYGILFALLLVGILISFTGIFNLIRARTGKSKWTTADEPPVLLAEEEEHKSGIGVKIFTVAFCGGILLFVYWVASFQIFLIFLAWIVFLAVYGIWIKYKKKKDESGQ